MASRRTSRVSPCRPPPIARILLCAALCTVALSLAAPPTRVSAEAGSAAGTEPRPAERGPLRARPNCGLASLRALARALGAPMSSQAWGGVCGAYPQETITMLELRDAAAGVGLALQGYRMSLDDLAAAGGPAIVHFKAGHFGTFVDCVGGNVRWLDGGEQWRVAPVAAFSESFSGYALLPADDPDRPARDPALRFAELDFDCGTVPEGSQLAHAFECKNVADMALRVAASRSSHGCTAEPERAATVQPGESLQFRVSGQARLGTTVHWVELASSDPVKPVQYVTLRARSPRPVSFWPQRVAILARKGEQASVGVRVSGAETLELPQVTSNLGCIALPPAPEPVEQTDDGRTLSIAVSLRDDTPPGAFAGELTIRTNDPRTPLIVIPVTIQVRGDIERVPRDVFFGFVPQGSGPESGVELRAERLPDFRILGVTCESPYVAATVSQSNPDGSYTVAFALSGKAPLGVTDAKAVVETNVPREEKIEIRVYAHVVAAGGR